MSFFTPCIRFLRRPSAAVSIRVSTSLLALPGVPRNYFSPPLCVIACSSPITPTSILFLAHHLRCPRHHHVSPSSSRPSTITTWRPQQVAVHALTTCRRPQVAYHPSPRDQPRSTPSTTWTSQRPRVPPSWSSADYLVKYLSSHYIFFFFIVPVILHFCVPPSVSLFFLLCIFST